MATINVPRDFATIQEAVVAAGPGDVVEIDPGVYQEQVLINTDDLTLKSKEGLATILMGVDREGIGLNVQANDVNILGMEIREFELGVLLDGNNNSLLNNRMLNNSGTAVKIMGNGNTMENNRVAFNNLIGADVKGQGNSVQNNRFNNNKLAAISNTKEELAESLIADNTISQSEFGVYMMMPTSCNNKMDGNLIERTGTGILMYGCENEIVNNVMMRQRMMAMMVKGDNNEVALNTVAENRDGMMIMGEGTTVSNNVMQNNQMNGLTLSGDNNMVLSNYATGNGTGMVLLGSDNVMKENVVIDNGVADMMNMGENMFEMNSSKDDNRATTSPDVNVAVPEEE